MDIHKGFEQTAPSRPCFLRRVRSVFSFTTVYNSANNVRFELGEAWSATYIRWGHLWSMDIDCNRGFHLFMQSFDGYQ